jgi:HEAT repeat protein
MDRFSDLLNSLGASMYENRLEAIQSLIEIGRDGVDRLLHVLSRPPRDGDPHDLIRGHVAEILGEIGDNRAFDLLVASTESQSEFLRHKSIAALGRLRDSRAIGLLVAHVRNHWDAETREEAAWALARFPEPWVIRVLVRAFSDSAEIVQDATVHTLIQMGQTARNELLSLAKTHQPPTLELITELLSALDKAFSSDEG